MRYAITGATGLLGANLAEILVEDGHDVVALRRSTSDATHLDHLPITWVEGDLLDLPSLVRTFEGADAAFHCAALISLRREPTPALLRTNVCGTLNVLNAARITGLERLVHAASVEALGVSMDGDPVDETVEWNASRLGTANGYARSKRQGMMAVFDAARRDVDAVVVTPAVMFGRYDTGPSSGKIIVSVCKGLGIAHPDGTNNFVHARDVARGMVQALERGRRGENYILGHENLTYREVFERVAEITGAPKPLFQMPRAVYLAAGVAGEVLQAITRRDALINLPTVHMTYAHGYRYTIDKARDELGYDPVPVDDAIRDAYAWFREQGYVSA